MTDFYTNREFAGRPLEYLARAFDKVISDFSRRGKRALNVLEIGAGEERWGFAFPIPFDVIPKVLAL